MHLPADSIFLLTPSQDAYCWWRPQNASLLFTGFHTSRPCITTDLPVNVAHENEGCPEANGAQHHEECVAHQCVVAKEEAGLHQCESRHVLAEVCVRVCVCVCMCVCVCVYMRVCIGRIRWFC